MLDSYSVTIKENNNSAELNRINRSVQQLPEKIAKKYSEYEYQELQNEIKRLEHLRSKYNDLDITVHYIDSVRLGVPVIQLESECDFKIVDDEVVLHHQLDWTYEPKEICEKPYMYQPRYSEVEFEEVKMKIEKLKKELREESRLTVVEVELDKDKAIVTCHAPLKKVKKTEHGVDFEIDPFGLKYEHGIEPKHLKGAFGEKNLYRL